ncbi:MAG TPA: GNAT family N-acetyltransferase [Bryobacteraceae bacterium]|nr:GNAT family N-acetyltransferase [Bryobacteraceae bacterium]
MESLLFRMFEPGDETAFRELNEAWIRQYFAIEAKDREVLGDPQLHILDRGGEIVMAVLDGKPVGCCALLAMPDSCFEIGKMAVSEEWRGRGIGRDLLAYAVRRGRERGAKRLYLETSTKLPNAIHLYESQGFRYLPQGRVQPSPYTRSDLFMEMFLE